MLDKRYLQEKLPELKEALEKRGFDSSFTDSLVLLSQRRKELIKNAEELKSMRNNSSKEIGALKAKEKAGDHAAKAQAEKLSAEMKAVGDQVKSLDDELKTVEEKLASVELNIPNVPDASVPVGKSADDNKEVHKHGTPGEYSFTPKDHVEIGEKLGILDFEKAGKISGARFCVYLGAGARLERALIQFMLDLHTTQHGYKEVIPPFMVSRGALVGTGQLPKFEEDLFKTSAGDRELFLIPTSEVPLTNLVRETIVDPGKLPFYYTAYSPCFRSEAGSYGKDTRGIIRQHQFQKVELVKITEAENSMAELDKMVKNAEKVLELLELPYRTMLLCSGDMGFGAVKTFDIEVWLPSQNTYREISSCSNCGDFQARRAEIKYRKAAGEKPTFAHTLNGSGLAVGRTFVAILENYQNEKGEVKIPKALHPYLVNAPGFERRGDDIYIAST